MNKGIVFSFIWFIYIIHILSVCFFTYYYIYVYVENDVLYYLLCFKTEKLFWRAVWWTWRYLKNHTRNISRRSSLDRSGVFCYYLYYLLIIAINIAINVTTCFSDSIGKTFASDRQRSFRFKVWLRYFSRNKLFAGF